MKAISFDSFGGPEVLKVISIPEPEVGPNNVLVHVDTVGVCHHDVMHRAGKLPGARPAVILGHEIAGAVTAVGSNVVTHKPGDKVVVYQREFCGICRHCLRGRMDLCSRLGKPGVDTTGGYAEYVSVPAVQTIHIPDNVPLAHAALASCPIGTSVRALRAVGGINPGDRVLITGASGGLGVHQIQLVRAFGGRSIAVTSSEQKGQALRELGADEVVISPALDFSRQVWISTDRRGVDIALENIGQTLGESLRCLATGGIAVVLGNIGVSAVSVSPGLVIGRRLRITGSGMGTYEDIGQGLALMQQGAVRPVIQRTFRFTEAANAHAMLDAKTVQGRVVLHGW